MRFVVTASLLTVGLALLPDHPTAQQAPPAATLPVHAKQVKRLLIRNAMVIPGPAVPAYGPTDILLEDGRISDIGSSTPSKWPQADATIDATGKYVMPGLVNTHMHWHEERVGPLPIQY